MYKRLISLILCASMMLSILSGCAGEPTPSDKPSEDPDVNITIVDKPTSSEAPQVVPNSDDNIASLVYSSVSHELQQRGYETTNCMAFSSDDTYTSVGIGYQAPDFQFFADSEYDAHGFVTIIGPEDQYQAMPTNCEYIAVEPLEGTFENGAKYNLVAYSCDTLGYNHFVYQDQYVIYYQLDATTVRYETYENKTENYDLSLGSLYDFDNEVFIYDASLFEGYYTHSGVELFSEEDYAALEAELKALSDAQEKDGYYVEELNIVYISPESIQAYLASEEEDTFFGYSVAELEASIGLGSALVFSDDGFEVAQYFEENPEDYNWKSFLTKVGIGTGIILVGAVLTPITGGASFGCALVTISTITLSASMAEGLGTLAIETVSGMIQGKEFMDALQSAVPAGLDAFANTFVITAAIASVGVASGIIKPVACFVAGTMIAVPTTNGLTYKPIETISVGDYVYSYNENSDTLGINMVTEVFVNRSETMIDIVIDGEAIITTLEHPFYVADNGWMEAKQLIPGMTVLRINGDYAIVDRVEQQFTDGTEVYNFTVANDHTYFVGENGVLVHNQCTTLQGKRQDGVNKAWQEEVKAIKKGESKYDWSKSEIKEILKNGKLAKESGYEGCHILDAKLYPEFADDPNNIIFLPKEIHFKLVHQGNFTNPSNWDEVVKLMPQFADQVADMLKLVS